MDIDKLKELIAERERIDEEIRVCVDAPESKTRKPQQCSICHSGEHTARNCPQKGSASGTG